MAEKYLGSGQLIADRALSQLGTPFRLHGRVPFLALDCVGLASFALEPFLRGKPVPNGYQMRGCNQQSIAAFFDDLEFQNLPLDSVWLEGDLIVGISGPSQMHFAIRADSGWVHADATLRKVVVRPGPLPWDICAGWRPMEDLKWRH